MSRSSEEDWPYGEDRRTEARERALALLYEAETKGLPPADVLAALPVPPDPLAVLLVTGVADHATRIDELVSAHARDWSLERMPVVDRTVLRLGTYELMERMDVPTAVVLDEAVELAKQYGGTDDSGRFVNGVLAAIARVARPAPAS